jgi:hypothetical protein
MTDFEEKGLGLREEGFEGFQVVAHFVQGLGSKSARCLF